MQTRYVRHIHLAATTLLYSQNPQLSSYRNMGQYSYEKIKEISDFLQSKTKIRPTIGIICGTGLGAISDFISDQDVVPYDKIPHFPQCTVAGHSGEMVFGKICDIEVMCMKGRVHTYEGYPLWLITMPVRVMKLCGVQNLIISNAAGGLNPKFKPGDVMVLRDHISFVAMAGLSPLVGPNYDKFGPRFIAMNRAYRRDLIKNSKKFWKPQSDANLQVGVYAVLGGPQFETVAENKYLATIGADAVGMSTSHEVTVALHCGIQCFGFSLITNMGVLDYESKDQTTSEEHVAVGESRKKDITNFVINLVQYIKEHPTDED